MIKRILAGLLALGLLVSTSWALGLGDSGIAFGNLKSQSKADIEALKLKKAELSLISAQLAENEIKGTRETMDKYGIPIDPLDALQFNIIQYTTVKKATLGLELQRKTSQVTRNAVNLGLRDLYMGVFAAKQGVTLKAAKKDLAALKLSLEEAKLKKGVSSRLALKGFELDLKRATFDLTKAQGDYNKLYQQLVQMAGSDVKIEGQSMTAGSVGPIETYTKGIDNRIEIQANRLQNEMAALALPYYEVNNILAYPDKKKEYDDTKREIAYREALIEKDRLAIRQELERAVVAVKSARNQIENLKLQRNQLSQRRRDIEAMVKKGLVTKVQLMDLDLGLMELDHGLNLAIMNYNIKRLKLNYATSIGPGYK